MEHFKRILALFFLALPLQFLSAQTMERIPGRWTSDYQEAKDIYHLTIALSFNFNSDGSYSQTGHYTITFNGKDHGTCVIDVASGGNWSVSDTKLNFNPSKDATTAEMSEIQMSKALEGLVRSTVLPKMIRRYNSPRATTIRSIDSENMVLQADDGRLANYIRGGRVSL